MRRNKVIASIFFLSITVTIILLGGCASDASPETITPAITDQTVDPIPIKEIKPTATTISATSMPALPYPDLPAAPGTTDPQDFKIVAPAAMDLLKLHEAGGDQVNYSYELDDFEDEIYEALRKDAYSLGRIVDFELQRYYPDGVSHPLQIFDEYSQEAYRNIPIILFDVLEKGVLEYLDINHLILEDGQTISGPSFEAAVYQIELDYDIKPEWLLQITSEWFILSHITLDQIESGKYEVIPSELPRVKLYSQHDDYIIRGTEDITGDGLSDIVIDYSSYLAGTSYGSFMIYMWNANRFNQISDISWSAFSGFYMESSLEYPKDGSLPYLQIDYPKDVNWGCEWTKSEIYRWPDGVEQLRIIGFNPPNTAECALARAVSLLKPVDDQTAIELLEKSVYLFSDSTEKHLDVEVFARYRLAVLYALYGNDSGARQQLEIILSRADEGNSEAANMLAAEITTVVEKLKIYAIPLCDIVFSKVKQDEPMPAGWENYTTDTVAVHAYPAGYEPFPPAGCPLIDILERTLAGIAFNPQISPDSLFREQGMSVIATPLYLTNPDVPIWFVHIDLGSPTIAAYIPEDSNYRWEVIYKFRLWPIGPLQQVHEDLSNDGYPEYAYAYQVEVDWWSGCDDGKSLYQFFVTTKAEGGVSVSFGDTICMELGESFDLREYLADADGDGLVDIAVEYANQEQEHHGINLFDVNEPWLTHAAIAEYIQNIADDEYEDEVVSPEDVNLITMLLEEDTRDQARPRLLAARSNLSANSLADTYLWQQYTYLLGLSYELEGNYGEAIGYYLEVWQSEEHTLWGNLAALKLSVK